MAPQTAAATHTEPDLTGADRPLHLVDVFRQHAPAYRAQNCMTPEQSRLLGDMERCRTAALGGHLYRCDGCGFEVPMYNSCLNRGCPQCQALTQGRWILAREERILPVGHHHVVFTLPSQLRPLAACHPREVYGLLLQTVGRVLTSLAEERLKARIGATLVLHTWTRELQLHPHVHCVVSAGGLSLDGQRWVDRRGYLFGIAQLKSRFRARLLVGLNELRRQGLIWDPDPEAWDRLFCTLPKAAQWVVYTAPPFGRSTHVLQYLGRYTHRVGLSDHRLVQVSDTAVTFRTRGEATVTLAPLELLRRYLRHVLPAGLNKIRHVGLYASAHVHGALARARALLTPAEEPQPARAEPKPPETWDVLAERLTGQDPLVCPACRVGRLVVHFVVPKVRSRAPPWVGR